MTESRQGITFVKSSQEEEFSSYKSLYNKALYILNNLQRKGLKPGDELVFQVEDNKILIVLFWAAILGKIIPVPISSGNREGYKWKLIKIWDRLKKPFLVSDADNINGLKKVIDENDHFEEFEKIRKKLIPLQELLEEASLAEPETPSPDDIAYIQYSSGSTGNPKGVILTHSNLVANTLDIADRSRITNADCMLSWMPLTHDMGMICFHLTGLITNINQYILPTHLFIRRPILWMDKADQHRVSLLYSPNFGFYYFLSALKSIQKKQWDLTCIRLIYNGAEPISKDLCAEFMQALECYNLRSSVIYPGYGLAEASVAVTLSNPGSEIISYTLNRHNLNVGQRVEDLEQADLMNGVNFVGVGSPIRKCQVRITDNDDHQVNDNIIGCIQIKGKNVTKGYYNDPKATEKLFTSDNWLRTGDLGFMRNGHLVITGRAKNIIIINGQNFYPQDIERIAQEEDKIELGKVVACGNRDETSGKDLLILFVLFKGNTSNFLPIISKLKERIINKIGIVVDKVIPVRKIPKTTSGKIQNFKLLELYNGGFFDEKLAEIEELLYLKGQENNIGKSQEQKLLSICNEVLGDQIKTDDNFFEYGINSLKATLLAAKIEDYLHISISIKEILDNPSIACLLKTIENRNSENGFDISPVESRDFYEVSRAQKRFWILDNYEKYLSPYNIPVSFVFRGRLDVPLFLEAFEHLVKRHEILRTTFVLLNGELMQKIHDEDSYGCDISYQDLSAMENAFGEAKAIAQYEANATFDLEKGPLLRVKLLKTTTEEYVFSLVIHHIIADGWSIGVIFKEINRFYETQIKKKKDELFSLDIQWKDYAAWQAKMYQKKEIKKNQEYWYNRFKGELPVLSLPTYQPRPAIQTFNGCIQSFTFSNDTLRSLNRISKENECTLFMTLVSILKILLFKYTGQKDIIIGTDIAGRSLKDLEHQIGCYFNTIVLKTKLQEDENFIGLVKRIKEMTLEAYEHQYYSFDQLIEELHLKWDLYSSPIFNVLVVFQNFGYQLELDDIKIDSFNTDIDTSLLDLHFEFIEYKDALSLNIRYNTDLFKGDQILRLGQHFKKLVQSVIDNQLREISLYPITLNEELDLFERTNNTLKVRNNYATIVEIFEESVKKAGNSLCVVSNDNSLTYRELNEKANCLAHYLRNQFDVKPEDKIGLILERTENLIIGLLAILKSGASYVPIDPDYPPERIKYILKDSGAEILFTDEISLEKISFLSIMPLVIERLYSETRRQPLSNPSRINKPNDLAYILYTSGSTGMPKGVIIEHNALADYVQTFINYFNINENDKVIQQSSLTFDTSIEEIFPALCVGGSVIVLKEGGKDIEKLLNAIEQNGATILTSTPAILHEINQVTGKSTNLRTVISGGDKLKTSDIDQIIKETDVYNTYGPTESTVCATFTKVDLSSEISKIGKPIANHKIYILDDYGNQQPIGVIGEICIHGTGLAREYLNNRSLTEDKFVKNPFGNGKLYHTGDLGKWDTEGNIEFIGRKDNQLKIRGYRVEIGEIDKVLISHPEIVKTVTIAKEDGNQNKYLISYYTGIYELVDQEIKEFLMQYLPEYMIPSFLIYLPSIPLTENGKIDYKALPAPETSILTRRKYVTPDNKLEEELVVLWKNVLKIDTIGVNHEFFELGGDSIKATRLLYLVKQKWRIEIGFKDIFLNSTIRRLADLIGNRVTSDFEEIKPIEEQEYYEVSNSQRRLWILDQFEESQLAYNLSWAYVLQGNLVIDALKKAFYYLIYRHESLRTTFFLHNGELKQKVHDFVSFDFKLKYDDLREKENIGEIIETYQKNAQITFDLEKGPLLRITLLHNKENEYLLFFTIHHIISDGWSIDALVNELVLLYNISCERKNHKLEPLSVQYKDYAFWQNNVLKSNFIRPHENYWKEKFKGDIPVLALPTDFQRPLIQTFNGDLVHFEFSETVKNGLDLFCRRNKVSLFITLLSVVKALFYRYTGQDDIVIGTPVLGREQACLQNQIGLYLNTLALRTSLKNTDSFETLLVKVKETVIDAQEHQIYPFDYLVESLNLRRDTSRSPLFDVMIGLQNIRSTEKRLSELKNVSITPFNMEKNQSQFDLSIDFFDSDNKLELLVEYNKDLYKKKTIQRLIQHINVTVEAVLSDSIQPINKLDYLVAKEKKELLVDFNLSEIPEGSENTIQKLFEQQVGKTPHANAVIFGSLVLNYRELNEKANQLAFYLRAVYNLKADDLVGLMLGRSDNVIVNTIGIIKSGAAFVPIDPEYPENRINHMVKDSKIKVLITDNSTVKDWKEYHVPVLNLNVEKDVIATYPCDNPKNVNSPDDLVYVIYTSGSLGQPKGVMVQHKNLVSIANSWRAAYKLDSFEVRLLQLASISFDVYCGDICRALLTGGQMIICPSELRLDFELLYRLIEKHSINVFESTPSLIVPFMNYIYDMGFDISFMELVILGSDICLMEDYMNLLNRFGTQMRIINSYGTTETTIDSCYFEEEVEDLPDKGVVPIGKPLGNTRLYILDDYGQIVPIGVIGELYIGGAGVGRGYLNRVGLTYEKFKPNKYSEGELLYRTGDLCCWLSDGNIEFVGRKDTQVKIRGYRIELGEIENSLLKYSGIEEALVVVQEGSNDEEYLVGYYVSISELKVSEIRTYLSEQLPDYMIPVGFMRLASFPLTSNGKLDRSNLPICSLEGTKEGFYEAPRTSVEVQVADIWQQALKRDLIGLKDNFFALGGHSLNAAHIVSRIYKELGKKIELRHLFTHSTIESLSKVISETPDITYGEIVSVESQSYYDLSHAQKRLWILDQFNNDPTAYNMPAGYVFEGSLNIDYFERSFKRLLDRHEILRTVFITVEGIPKQQVHSLEDIGFKLEYIDLRHHSDSQQRVRDLGEEDIGEQFDLEKGPLLRGKLVQIDEVGYIFLFNMHHIISDGWSTDVLIDEIISFYNGYVQGAEVNLGELRIQYKEYSSWQNKLLLEGSLSRHRAYWMDQFKEEVLALEMPLDYVRSSVLTFKGDVVTGSIERDLYNSIERLSQSEGVSLFMFLISCVNVLLYRYTGQSDIVLGTPVAGREHPDLEGQIGFYVNTLALRIQVEGGESFANLLSRVKAMTLNGYAHQQYPFDRLVEELELNRDMSRHALFDIMVVLQNTEVNGKELQDMEGVTVSDYNRALTLSKFDIVINFVEEAAGIKMHVEYNTNLFKRERIERFIDHYKGIVRAVLKDLDQPVCGIDYLGDTELEDLTVNFNNTRVSFPADKSIQELFESQVFRTPDAIAVCYGEQYLSYGELNERSNRLGAYLRESCGVGCEDLIGIMLDKSEKLMVGILGILKSGGAYLPIDPGYPKDRKAYMISDSNLKVLLTEGRYSKDLDFRLMVDIDSEEIYANEAEDLVINNYSSIHNYSSDLIYVIYTSGTTGHPKGVQVEHRSVVNLSTWLSELIYKKHDGPFTALLTASVSFDASVQQLFPPLLNGGKLVVLPEEKKKDPDIYISELVKHQVEVIDITPSYLSVVLLAMKGRNEKLNIKYTLVGGEVLGEKLFKDYVACLPNSELINVYGITEATVNSTFELVQDERASKWGIGKPLGNTRLYILDDYGQIVPIGVIGELYIGGAGVGRGYLNRVRLTYEKFKPNKYSEGELLYRTGDLCCWLSDGNIEFVGRKDTQVKIRGYRIELGEIENSLLKYSGIEEALVVVQEGSNDEEYLVGYYVSISELKVSEIRTYLSEQLPDYMIPVGFMRLASFPLTSNGKLDRSNLPICSLEGTKEGFYEAPRTSVEVQVADIWQQALKRDLIGLKDNFFALGGHSLNAAHIVSRIYKELGKKIELRHLFTHSTIESLSKVISETPDITYGEIVSVESQSYYDLSHAQKRLWILDQFNNDPTAYNMPAGYVFEGSLNIDYFERSFKRLLDRHEILRTVFITVEGIPKQQVHSLEDIGFKLEYIDLRHHSDSQQRVRDLGEEDIGEQFDLEKGPLLRGKLVQIDEVGYIFLFNMHHIISDGWSTDVLIDEIISFYNGYVQGAEVNLGELRIQYKEYSSWQNKLLLEGSLSRHRAYWMDQFKEEVLALEMPLDYVRSSVLTFKGDVVTGSIERDLYNSIERLSQSEGVSLFMFLISCVNVLLYRYTGQSDIVLGTPVAGREHPDLEGQIGFYVNTLALRIQVEGGESFANLLSRVKAMTLNGYAHQQYPFDRLVEELELNRDMSRHALFDIMVVLQNTEVNGKELQDMEGVTVSDYNRALTLSKFDIVINFVEEAAGIKMHVEYNTNLFKRERIERFIDHYKGIVRAVLKDLDQPVCGIDYLGDTELEDLTVNFNNTRVSFPADKSIQELFESQVFRTPDAIAVCYGEQYLSYGELNERSNRLGAYLRESCGVGCEDLIGIMLDKSEKLMVGILGILKSGGAYLPIDPGYPKDRKAYMISDSNLKVLLTEGRYSKDLDFRLMVDIDSEEIYANETEDLVINNYSSIHNYSSDLIYVIYTSGTTGHPKGVQVEHRSVVNLSTWLSELIYKKHDGPFTALLTASVSFDTSVKQLFPPLLNGGKLVVLPEEKKKDPDIYISELVKHQVEVIDITPSYLSVVLLAMKGRNEKLNIKYTLVGGEVLKSEVVDDFYGIFQNNNKLINIYGVTEATVDSTYEIVNSKKRSKNGIGKVLPNTTIYILDNYLNLVPIGVTGKIYIAGEGLSRGYLNRPDLTNSRFIKNPYKPQSCLYDTGDLGRWSNDGSIDFLGRDDFQVKIRGYRIELGEIESVILKYPGISNAVVIANEDEKETKYVAAYIICNQQHAIAGLRKYLSENLPEYIIPSYLVLLDKLPLNIHGKIDYKALPDPNKVTLLTEPSHENPENEIERALLSIWQKVLDREDISVNNNFFEIGGNSIKVIQLHKEINMEFPKTIAVHEIFSNPTIRKLATQLSNHKPQTEKKRKINKIDF